MKTIISSLLLISALSTPAFATENSKKTPKMDSCVELFEICVEIRKSLIFDMMEHNKSGSEKPFLMPEYTDQQCIQELVEKEQSGLCKD